MGLLAKGDPWRAIVTEAWPCAVAEGMTKLIWPFETATTSAVRSVPALSRTETERTAPVIAAETTASGAWANADTEKRNKIARAMEFIMSWERPSRQRRIVCRNL